MTTATAALRPPASARLWVRRHRFELVLVLPMVVYVGVLTFAPIVDTFRLSLTFRGDFPATENYEALWRSTVFRRAVVNTIVVALLSLGLQLLIGLGVALMLHVKFFGRGFVRTVTLVPLGVPTIVSGAIMLLIFSRAGYLNAVLFHVNDLVNLIPGLHWQFRPLALQVAGGWRTLLTIAVADMWKVLPIVTLIFLAGLQSIPDDVYEAAQVDGATRWQQFWRVTFPLLIPYMTMAIILRAIDAFRIFELALVLSGRIEPVLGTFIWRRYAPPTSDPFTAAAGSIVLFVLIMVFIVLYLKLVAVRGEAER